MPSHVKESLDVLIFSSSATAQIIDQSVLAVVSHVFPFTTQGADFLQRFVEQAIAKDGNTSQSKHTLSLCCRSIAVLGQTLGFSNDTTHKYVTLYSVLGILTKQKAMSNLIFQLSIGPYEPPATLEADLERLIRASRPKLRVLAQQVKERCYVYGLIASEWTQQLRLLQSFLQPEQHRSRRKREQHLAKALELTNTLLKRSINPPPETDANTHLSVSSTSSLVVRREGASSSPTTSARLPYHSSQEDITLQQEMAPSTSPTISRRRELEFLGIRVPKIAPTEDAFSSHASEKSPFLSSLGRRTVEPLNADIPKIAYQGDEDSSSPAAASPNSSPSGRLERASSSMSLPTEPVLVDAPLRNVLDICNYIKTYTHSEPRRIAEMLAEELEQDRRVAPKYLKLLREPGKTPRDPHVIAAAFLTTLIRLHRDRWTIERPGGFFTVRCREYDLAIPQEVEEWVTQYGTLSLAEIRSALASASPASHPRRQEASSQPFTKPAPKPLYPPLTLNIPIETEQVQMSKQEAQTVEQMILKDRRTRLYRTKVLRMEREGQPNRYALLVDAGWFSPRSPQTIVYSQAEWQHRLDTMCTWRDLFGLPALPFAKKA